MKNIVEYFRKGGWCIFVLVLVSYILCMGYPLMLASNITAKMTELTGWAHTVVVYVQSGVIALACLVVLFVMRRKKRLQDEACA